MSEENGFILKAIREISSEHKDNPLQHTISLVALLVDKGFSDNAKGHQEIITMVDKHHETILKMVNDKYDEVFNIATDILKEHETIDKRVRAVEKRDACPLKLDDRLELLLKRLEIPLFYTKHPKFAIIATIGFVIGISALGYYGIPEFWKLAGNLINWLKTIH